MNATRDPEPASRRAVLSTLWIFVLFNYVYADLAMMMFSSAYARAAAGMSPGFVLLLAVLMEVPIAMILLSRILPYGPNRWANILAGAEGTAWVGLTLSGGAIPPFYLFIALIEMATTAFIAWYAWTWRAAGEGTPRPRWSSS